MRVTHEARHRCHQDAGQLAHNPPLSAFVAEAVFPVGVTPPRTVTSLPPNGGNCSNRGATRRRHAEERLLKVQNPRLSPKRTAGMEGVGGTGWHGQASRRGLDRGARWATVAWPGGDAPQSERHADRQATLQPDTQRRDTPTRAVLCPQFRMQFPRDLCAAQNCIGGIATFSRYVESSLNRIACDIASIEP